MPSDVLGRTNLVLPPIWLSLSVPRRHASTDAVPKLIEAALQSAVPIDITSGPALWGGHMRGTDAFLTSISASDYENATDDSHALHLMQAHLLQTLSGIGRDRIDIYFLRVRRAVEEYQIMGALEALEMAKQEGHIRFIGLCCDGPGLATLGMWQFHDAFEVLLVPRNHLNADSYSTLAPMARERRVGIVTSRPLNWGGGVPFCALSGESGAVEPILADLSSSHPVMVGVRSADEVRAAVAAASNEGCDEIVARHRTLWGDNQAWADLAARDPDLARRRPA